MHASLPTFPLSQYEADVAALWNTDVERIVKERVGQGYFRRALLDYWGGCCPYTRIREEALLRASHIVPWAKCSNDEERLDVFDGLFLAAHWDAAFDSGLVSFDDDGRALVKSGLVPAVVSLPSPATTKPIPLDPQHQPQIAWHRKAFGFG